MPNIIQDLKLKSDPSTIVNPNIVSDNIPSGAVTTAKIASNAVTAGKIASGAVTASKIENGAVQQAHISVGAVTEPKIGTGAVTTAKIADGAITGAKIADNTIDGYYKIQDGTITLTKLGRKIMSKSEFVGLYPDFASFAAFMLGLSPDEFCRIKFFIFNSSGYLEAVHFAFKPNSPYEFVYSTYDTGSNDWVRVGIGDNTTYANDFITFLERVILYTE